MELNWNISLETLIELLSLLLLVFIRQAANTVWSRRRRWSSYLLDEDEQEGTAEKRYHHHLLGMKVCLSSRRTHAGNAGAGRRGWGLGGVDLFGRGTKRSSVSCPNTPFHGLLIQKGNICLHNCWTAPRPPSPAHVFILSPSANVRALKLIFI